MYAEIGPLQLKGYVDVAHSCRLYGAVLFLIIQVLYKNTYDMSVAIKNRTRDEIIAAFRESIRRKQEWEKQAQEEFKRIREERRLLSIQT